MPPATTQSIGSWRDELTALLTAQRDAVSRLGDLASAQGEHIRSGRTDALLSLLGRRQELIDSVLSTHGRMQSLLESVREELDRLSEADRTDLRTMIDEINALLAQVLERDEQDRELLDEARSSVKKDLASMTSVRQARNAYLSGSRQAATDNRFADEQG
jgi:DNA-binding phage protein